MSSAHCSICNEDIEQGDLTGILDHLRVMHPDEYGDGPPRWPDGGVIVEVDDSVDYTVEDIKEAGA